MSLQSRPIADENAFVSLRGVKAGNAIGSSGPKGYGRQPCKPSGTKFLLNQAQRKALGDLTNTIQGSTQVLGKVTASKGQPMSDAPVENMAGKAWSTLEAERRAQEGESLQQRLHRIRSSAHHWTTSHMPLQECSTSDKDDADSGVSCVFEHYSESPLVVQLPSPQRNRDTHIGGACFDWSSTTELPEYRIAPLSLDFCWSDEDELY